MRSKSFSKLGYVPPFLMLLFFSACLIMTVNVYFPEKDVQTAFQALEDELMAAPGGATPADTTAGQPAAGAESGATSAPAEGAAPATEGEKSPTKDQGEVSFSLPFLPRTAYAAEDLSAKIQEEIKSRPEVVAAYQRMGARLKVIDGLRNAGQVGEAKDGLLAYQVDKAKVPAEAQKAVAEENSDREVVINAMAQAILKSTNQPQDAERLKQVKPQAAESFAKMRRDRASKGWMIQLPDGTWTRK